MNRWIEKICIVLVVTLLLWQTPPANAQFEDRDPFEDGGPLVAPGGGVVAGGPNPQGPPEASQEELQAIQTALGQAAQLAQQARALAEQEQVDAALAKYDEALSAAGANVLPDVPPIQFDINIEKGRLLRELEYNREAIPAFMQAGVYMNDPTIAPEKVPQLFIELGQTYLDIEEYNTAIEFFAKGLSVPGQGQNAELWFNKGVAEAEFAKNQQFATPQQRQTDIQKALDSYDRAIRLNPQYAEAYFERGMTRQLMQDSDKAIDDFEQSVALDPSNTEAVARLGISSLNRALIEANRREGQQAKIDRDLKQAVTQMTRFLDVVPARDPDEEDSGEEVGREDILLQRSAAYIAQGDEASGDNSVYYQNAIADAEAVIELEPDAQDGFFQKAIALRMLGDFDAAIDAYGEALARSPANFQVLLRRGILHFRQGDYEDAKTDLKKGLTYSGGYDARTQFWLGLCYSRTNESKLAIRHYSAAIKLQANFSVALYNRGIEYMKIGRLERATADFSEVLRQDDSNDQARALRDQLTRMAR